jgi:hypothetical protein
LLAAVLFSNESYETQYKIGSAILFFYGVNSFIQQWQFVFERNQSLFWQK